MSPSVITIKPAIFLRSEKWPRSSEFATSELHFEVPLRHEGCTSDCAVLKIVARIVYDEVEEGEALDGARDWVTMIRTDAEMRARPIILYLCGGPGADNPPDRVPEMNRWLLRQGYSIFYVDYRGCGDSTPVRPTGVLEICGPDPAKQAHYIAQFCQDNIVRDLEAIRLCLSHMLSGDSLLPLIKWTTLGQSYGGYISLTYLSTHPEGLAEVFITGGLPPCGMDIMDYFEIEYRDIIEQNNRFFSTYDDANTLIRRTLGLISQIGPKNIPMTGRGYMSGQKLLTLGRQFGSKVGFPEVYSLLQKIERELAAGARLSCETIKEFEKILHVDERPLYPILLEQTWCSGGRTGWAAERVAREIPGFEYLKTEPGGKYPDPSMMHPDQPIYLTANTYCRFHFDTHEELVDLKDAAEVLAEHEWECPYDYDKLAKNRVPVYAIVFEQDMHLDSGVSIRTAEMVRGLQVVKDAGWHQDIRYKPAEVLENLFRARKITLENQALETRASMSGP